MKPEDLVVGDIYEYNGWAWVYREVGLGIIGYMYLFEAEYDASKFLASLADLAKFKLLRKNMTPTTPATSGPLFPFPSWMVPLMRKDTPFSQATPENFKKTYGDFTMPTPETCECGAHKVGSNAHSTWCALGDKI